MCDLAEAQPPLQAQEMGGTARAAVAGAEPPERCFSPQVLDDPTIQLAFARGRGRQQDHPHPGKGPGSRHGVDMPVAQLERSQMPPNSSPEAPARGSCIHPYARGKAARPQGTDSESRLSLAAQHEQVETSIRRQFLLPSAAMKTAAAGRSRDRKKAEGVGRGETQRWMWISRSFTDIFRRRRGA